MGQGDPSEDFANDAQKRDAVVVVAITVVTLVLVYSDYVGISHVLGDVSLLPAQVEELMKQLQDGLLPMLLNFQWDTILTQCLAAAETVDGYAELLQCPRVVKLYGTHSLLLLLSSSMVHTVYCYCLSGAHNCEDHLY